jgi:hypothetical protein
MARRFGTVRPRLQIPGPRPISEFRLPLPVGYVCDGSAVGRVVVLRRARLKADKGEDKARGQLEPVTLFKGESLSTNDGGQSEAEAIVSWEVRPALRTQDFMTAMWASRRPVR